MIIKGMVTQGQIYFIDDPESATADKTYRHPYLIISPNITGVKANNNLGQVQAMRMSTLGKYDSEKFLWEIPIISYDNSVRYVVPYNIYSFRFNKSIADRDLKGMIQSTEFGTTQDFIDFLMEIYMHVNSVGHVDVEYLKAKRDKYIEVFEMYKERFNATEIDTYNRDEEDDDSSNFKKAASIVIHRPIQPREPKKTYSHHSAHVAYNRLQKGSDYSDIQKIRDYVSGNDSDDLDDYAEISTTNTEEEGSIEYIDKDGENMNNIIFPQSIRDLLNDGNTNNEISGDIAVDIVAKKLVKSNTEGSVNISKTKGRRISNLTDNELIGIVTYVTVIGSKIDAAKNLGMTRYGLELRLSHVKAELESRSVTV